MKMRASLLVAPIALLLGCSPDSMTPTDPVAGLEELPVQQAKGGRPAAGGMVYVQSQGLYYKTFVPVETLPDNGRFQKLGPCEEAEVNCTMYGPGDPGYLGGRWWVDVNGNDIQDAEDSYLLCPLLGRGHASP